jgi:hypothetical protein
LKSRRENLHGRRVGFMGELDVDVLIGSKTDNELKGGTTGGGR